MLHVSYTLNVSTLNSGDKMLAIAINQILNIEYRKKMFVEARNLLGSSLL